MMNMAQNNQEKWVVILGDQVASRMVDNREIELLAIKEKIKEHNTKLKDLLVVPISMSQGDEIQTLVRTPMDAWKVIETFDTNSWIISFRYTIGIGHVSTGVAERTWDMDGSCFHHARDAMEQAKQESRWVTMRGLGDEQDSIVNGAIRSLQLVREGWTNRQRQAYAVRRGPKLQKVAAELMNLDQSTLSKLLKAAHYNSYLEMERALLDLMKVFWYNDAIQAGERIAGFIESQERRRDD